VQGGVQGGVASGMANGAGLPMVDPLLPSHPDDPKPFDLISRTSGLSFPSENWDPKLSATGKIPGILQQMGSISDDDIKGALQTYYPNWSDGGSSGQGQQDVTPLEIEIKAILRLRADFLDRRADEIVDQAGAFDHYFNSMLSVSDVNLRATREVITLCILIGGMFSQQAKGIFMRPRPVQIYPAMMPFIATPSHPSFPSGHATQAFLVAKMLSRMMQAPALEPYLFSLANRIAENREIAGLHYESDSRAGKELAEFLADKLVNTDAIKSLEVQVKDELKHFNTVEDSVVITDILADPAEAEPAVSEEGTEDA
jgi:hypothetical protein